MIVIYGKDGCPNCKAAIQLCEMNGLPYEYHDIILEHIDSQVLVEKAGGAAIRSVPQIWNNDLYVGGYTNFKSYLNNFKQLNG